MMHTQSAIFEQYEVAKDRKLNPVNGKSYTNYLYNQGLDKILKKVGEESFETVIAAKNRDVHEIAGEINDVLYHVIVLLCYQDITLDSVMQELNLRCASENKEIDELYEIIAKRQDIHDGQSYTAYLFTQGLDKILKKIGEACSMLIISAKSNDNAKTAYETADLLYHIMVMLIAKNIDIEEIAVELDVRSGKTGNLKQFHSTNLNS